MRKISYTGISIFTLFVSLAPSAMAGPMDYISGEGAWYGGVLGGWASAKTIDATSTSLPGGPSFDLETKLKEGFSLGAVVGRQITPLFRSELEVSYSKFNNDTLSLLGVTSKVGGEISALYVLGNLWADINLSSKFTPYIGGGLGVAFLKNRIDNGGIDDSDKDQKFAYQLGGGIKYPLSVRTSLDIGYRYKSVLGADFVFGGFS